MEGMLPKKYGDDAVEIPGARALLQDLIDRKKPWAIVTSGSMPLVSGVSDFVFVIADCVFSYNYLAPLYLLPLVFYTHCIAYCTAYPTDIPTYGV